MKNREKDSHNTHPDRRNSWCIKRTEVRQTPSSAQSTNRKLYRISVNTNSNRIRRNKRNLEHVFSPSEKTLVSRKPTTQDVLEDEQQLLGGRTMSLIDVEVDRVKTQDFVVTYKMIVGDKPYIHGQPVVMTQVAGGARGVWMTRVVAHARGRDSFTKGLGLVAKSLFGGRNSRDILGILSILVSALLIMLLSVILGKVAPATQLENGVDREGVRPES
jgi:hypothetical protein